MIIIKQSYLIKSTYFSNFVEDHSSSVTSYHAYYGEELCMYNYDVNVGNM